MQKKIAFASFSALVTSSILATHSAAVGQSEAWTTYQNARHGYSIGYPGDVFEERPSNQNVDGRLVVSRDGRVKLLVGAFANEDNLSLDAYRQFLIDGHYAGAKIDYAPVRDRWFVLSGIQDGTGFYERVTFTCDGRVINSWALLYPAEDQKRLERLIEQIARSYSVSGRPNCG